MGELFTTEAKRKGLAGAVIDGAVRDVARVRTLGFPVYARLITPMAGASGSMTSAPIPISCGGVTVLPGDIIIGDDDGIVAVSEAELMDILPAAEAIRRTEAEALRRMAAGESLLDMLNFDEHLDAIRAGRKSQLHFLF
jgi:regulator of RNase E activity RraA